MPHFVVSWEIDIEAGTPEQAARQALAIQRDPESTATVFHAALHGACPSCRQHAVHKASCRFMARHGKSHVDAPIECDLSDRDDRQRALYARRNELRGMDDASLKLLKETK